MDDFTYFRWVVLPALVVLGRVAWVRWRARKVLSPVLTGKDAKDFIAKMNEGAGMATPERLQYLRDCAKASREAENRCVYFVDVPQEKKEGD